MVEAERTAAPARELALPGVVHGLEIDTLWDGLFHVVTWLAVLVGLALLYSRLTRAPGRVWTLRSLWGWILVGRSSPCARPRREGSAPATPDLVKCK
ncbi:DUF2243 domain-containing protein [Rhodococcus ruber]|uniref:DUF2243 domain-containing protein n=1 Tax=Rhodococcus ruber TaxID=1830 RepID=UPI000F52A55C|nr:DUF2243 domain-containing protein [Rhodococcus ruber]RQM34931.1 hypothetical protein TN91_06805 [Rhodococcus ruber]